MPLGTLCFHIFLPVRIRNEHHHAVNLVIGMGAQDANTVCSQSLLTSGLASKGNAACSAQLLDVEILPIHMM